MPVVVVDVGPLEAPPALARELSRACTEVVYDGECVFSSADARDADIVTAIVRWEGARERRVNIEVGTPDDDLAVVSKVLVFKAADARIERWRSVGLTVAMLASELAASRRERGAKSRSGEGPPGGAVAAPSGLDGAGPSSASAEREGEAEPEGEDPAPEPDENDVAESERRARVDEEDAAQAAEPEPASTRDAPARDSTRAEAQPTRYWVEIGALGGPGFDGGVRSGGWVGAGWHPFAALLPLFGRVTAAHAGGTNARSDVGARWTSVGLGAGAGLEWPEAWLRLEPSVSAAAELLSVSATEDTSGRRDDGSRLEWGVQGAVALVLQTGWLRPLVGVEGHWLAAPTEIRVQDRVLARFPAAGWNALVAARIVP